MAAKGNVDLLFNIDAQSAKPLYQQVYEQVRDAAFAGFMTEGQRLPSIRNLSKELGLSHTTIEQAYLQLSVEGIVRTVPRSGYVVEHLDTSFLQLGASDNEEAVLKIESARNRDAFYAEHSQGGKVPYDFSYANLPADSFPVKTWRQLINEVLYANTSPAMARYSYADEPTALSCELARYLARVRGVNCQPSQILPQAGTDGALGTVLQLFDRDRHLIGMEEPGYATVRETAHRLGFSLAALPTDKGVDTFLEAIETSHPKIIFTTPSHQFPTGKVLQLDARTRLLEWARKNDAYVIEDDSCNEYRYGTRPIPSLQSLDAFNRVIYLCNFSKVLSPSMRVAYLVLPPKLLSRYLRLFNYAHPSVPWLEQEVLARFIQEGHLDQQVRRMTASNRKRHDTLLSALREAFGDHLDIEGAHAGLHFYVTVHNGMTQKELLSSAYDQGVALYGTKRFWFSRPAPEAKVMVGFSSIDPDDISVGVAALKKAWLPNQS